MVFDVFSFLEKLSINEIGRLSKNASNITGECGKFNETRLHFPAGQCFNTLSQDDQTMTF